MPSLDFSTKPPESMNSATATFAMDRPAEIGHLATETNERQFVIRSDKRKVLVVTLLASALWSVMALSPVATLADPEMPGDPSHEELAKELCDAMPWPPSVPPRGGYTETTAEPSRTYPGSTSYTVTYEGGECHVILRDSDCYVYHGPHYRPLGYHEG